MNINQNTFTISKYKKNPSRLRRDGTIIVFSCERSTKTKAGGCLADLLFLFIKYKEINNCTNKSAKKSDRPLQLSCLPFLISSLPQAKNPHLCKVNLSL